MSTPQEQQRWERLAPLRPRLRASARVYRHRYRGQRWYVLEDRDRARFHRFGVDAYRALRLLDGRRTAAEIEASAAAACDGSLSRDAFLALLDRLHAEGLIDWDVRDDPDAVYDRNRRARRARWLGRLRSPHVQRFALIDPDAVLERCQPLVHVLFSPITSIVWLVVVLGALVAAAGHAGEIAGYARLRGFGPSSLLALALLYAFVKGVHELAHACAVKRWGGAVHEMGVMLLLLMPLPYVDASAASAFPEKGRRMLVGAAGILAELFLAALAVLLWITVETGAVRDLAYGVLLIGGLSTVLFNGNPLLRFDGYYVLADAIEIPNLGARSNRFYGYLVERYLFGNTNAVSPVTAPGERGWFIGYAPAAFLYRIGITLGIALMLATEYRVIGALLAAWVLAGQLVYPLVLQLRYVARSPSLEGRRVRALATLVLLLGALAGAALVVPVPMHSYAQGVVWLPERAHLRAQGDGFVVQVAAPPGAPVRAGQALIALDDPLLESRIDELEWRVRELRARRHVELRRDTVAAGMLAEQIAQVRAELAEARDELAGLVLRAPVSGVFVSAAPGDAHGRFVRKGEVLGYVIEPVQATARVAVDQEHIGLVRDATTAVHVRLASRPWETVAATLGQLAPLGSNRLPTRALGTRGGGLIEVFPDDEAGLETQEPVFQLEVALPGVLAPGQVGMRVHVRFEHGRTTLAARAQRALRGLLLRRLSV